jgi:hypothetical protein
MIDDTTMNGTLDLARLLHQPTLDRLNEHVTGALDTLPAALRDDLLLIVSSLPDLRDQVLTDAPDFATLAAQIRGLDSDAAALTDQAATVASALDGYQQRYATPPTAERLTDPDALHAWHTTLRTLIDQATTLADRLAQRADRLRAEE